MAIQNEPKFCFQSMFQSNLPTPISLFLYFPFSLSHIHTHLYTYMCIYIYELKYTPSKIIFYRISISQNSFAIFFVRPAWYRKKISFNSLSKSKEKEYQIPMKIETLPVQLENIKFSPNCTVNKKTYCA